jgi:hypothetical protein
MKVRYSKNTDEDFRKHRAYLRKTRKTDGHKYQKYELDGISKSLKKNISGNLSNKKEHKDSIFPKEYDYSSKDYKMYVDKDSHHIVFYKIDQDGNGRKFISIEKCIHSTELKKQLDEKGIKPLKNADESLLDDLNDVYKEDGINQKDDNEEPEESGKEEEIYDEETGKKIKRIVFTGPKGGRYYKTSKGEKVYVDENKTYKNLKTILLESKIRPLSGYILKKVKQKTED